MTGGAVGGLLTNASGATASNSGTLSAGVLNSGTFTSNSGGVVNGGLTNFAVVNAAGGQINGAIDNKPTGMFTVTGAVASTGVSTFLNESGANLNVNAGGTYTLSGLLTNAGTVNVASNGELNASAGGVQNQGGGKIVNLGTVLDDLNNAGLVLNYGAYTATVASNSGSICNGSSSSNATCGSINNSSATWSGIVGTMTSNTGTIWNYGTWDGSAGVSSNGTGTIDNENLWKGSWSNNGGTINNAGTITGDVTNNSGIVYNNSASSVIGGSVTANGGIVYSDNPTSTIGGSVSVPGALPADVFALGKIGGNVSVNGGGTLGSFYVGDQTASIVTSDPTVAASLNSHLGQTLTVGGNVSGPVTIPINLSNGMSNRINAASANGGVVNLSGMLTNPNNLLWANRTLTYATGAGIPLSGASDQLLAGASSAGFYQYTPQNNDSILQSLKAGVVSAPAAQVSSIITALTTSFFQNAQAFLGVPTNPTPNLLYGGVWSRGGGAAITLETTATGGGSSYSTETKSINDIGGYQFGIDEGLYNINNTKMNVHLGLTAGEAFASSSDTFSTPGLFQTSNGVSTNANVPFYGVYAALTGNGLAATFQWRRNLFDLSLTDPSLGTQGPQKLNAQGNTESIDVGYQMPFGNGYSFTPAVAFYFTQTNVDSLGVGSSIFQFDTLNSTLGRFGGRLATAYTLNENLFLVPYLTLNVWHEFQGTSTTNFSQLGSTALPVPAVTTNSVGTFGQVSLGFATQSPKSNITTYLQADLRVGSNIQGWGVMGGLRYSY